MHGWYRHAGWSAAERRGATLRIGCGLECQLTASPPDFGRERAVACRGKIQRSKRRGVGVLKKQLAVCAWLLLLGAVSAGTVEAQPVYPGAAVSEAGLPPYEIMSIVRSTGLAPLTRPMRRGPYYVLVAIDRVGRQMRVVVDARLGDIVNLRPAASGPELARASGPPAGAPEAEAPPPPGVGALPPGESALALPPPPRRAAPYADLGPAPIPPRSVPALRPPSALGPAAHLAVREPASAATPPLPRPRPHLASSDVRAPTVSPAPAPPGAATAHGGDNFE